MRCDRLLFSIIELIAECLYSLLGGLMIALVVILTRGRRCSWWSLGRRTTDWTSVKWCLMALIHLRLLSISWRPGLRYSWGSRIVICLFHDIRSTLMMLILLTKRSYLLSLSFKTWKNSVWVDIFFILIGSLWTLCNWWFTHHWWFRWETLGCVIGSRDSIIFRGVNIGGSRLSRRGTRRRNTCLLFLLFFIFFRSLSRRWISWLIWMQPIWGSVMVHSSLNIIIASINVFLWSYLLIWIQSLCVVFGCGNCISRLAITTWASSLASIVCISLMIHLSWLYSRRLIFNSFWQLGPS